MTALLLFIVLLTTLLQSSTLKPSLSLKRQDEPTEEPTEAPTDQPTESPTNVPTTSNILNICVNSASGGIFVVGVPCDIGDWSCQAKYVCQSVLGQECFIQSTCCCGSCTGSWYSPVVGFIFFNYEWDINNIGVCNIGGYGNICGDNPSQMNS